MDGQHGEGGEKGEETKMQRQGRMWVASALTGRQKLMSSSDSEVGAGGQAGDSVNEPDRS